MLLPKNRWFNVVNDDEDVGDRRRVEEAREAKKFKRNEHCSGRTCFPLRDFFLLLTFYVICVHC